LNYWGKFENRAWIPGFEDQGFFLPYFFPEPSAPGILNKKQAMGDRLTRKI
jgi:hypothetical protein